MWGKPPNLNFQVDFCKVVGTKKGTFACLMQTFASEYGSEEELHMEEELH